MFAPRTLLPVLAVALVSAGCSGSGTTASASPEESASSASPAASATPSASPSSAFCLDLSTFQVGSLAYRADAGKAINGEPLDFKELRRKAILVLDMGDRMKSSAPPDIAEHFRTVLKAIKASSSKLKEGSTVRDVVDPLYGKKNAPAFEALNGYECKPAS
ncbi:hypothetical protein E1281_11135 [Actinomadura sp. KC345]|uniref:hypothetical protein n=1 Tax=Actinomadura sp. KC345 TaxID=2530371 RepID=UPI0010488571|nr:hypothetical protein [Actinomadura sp. KC345]TDC55721.1 hypothetical protein E1281_11135 [Actinomadura sp. KC345]